MNDQSIPPEVQRWNKQRINIQDQAARLSSPKSYSEAMDEIARLKKRLEEMSQKETYKEWQRNQAEIKRLNKDVESWKGAHSVASTDRDIASAHCRKAGKQIAELEEIILQKNTLLYRAADALGDLCEAADVLQDDDPGWSEFHSVLIAELRKAAE